MTTRDFPVNLVATLVRAWLNLRLQGPPRSDERSHGSWSRCVTGRLPSRLPLNQRRVGLMSWSAGSAAGRVPRRATGLHRPAGRPARPSVRRSSSWLLDGSRCNRGLSQRRGGDTAFTLLEIMLAVAIFGMVVTAIYTSWSAILKASRAGRDASADMQRSRIAARTLEDALVSTVMYAGNPGLYAFMADTSGDFAALSFVSRLPPSFPGSGYFGDQVVRRVEFLVEPSPEGGAQLLLRQMPLLQTNMFGVDEHTIVLARDMSAFMIEFCYQRGNAYEWVQEWRLTNQLPKLVRFALAFGKAADASGKPKSVTVRTVGVPSTPVPRDSQQPMAGAPGARGPGQPGQPGFPDGSLPGQGIGPGSQDPRQGISGRFGAPVRGPGTGGGFQ